VRRYGSLFYADTDARANLRTRQGKSRAEVDALWAEVSSLNVVASCYFHLFAHAGFRGISFGTESSCPIAIQIPHHEQALVGGYHTVKVEAHAQDHGKLTVYTRSGYLSKHSPIRN
jgi:hypothetical protein